MRQNSNLILLNDSLFIVNILLNERFRYIEHWKFLLRSILSTLYLNFVDRQMLVY